MLLTLIVILAAQLSHDFVETRKASLKVVERILGLLRNDYFDMVTDKDSEMHQLRVTLFKPKRIMRELCVQRPAIYARCGTHSASKTCFHFDEHIDKCEGVVGRAWYKDGPVTAQLPPWPVDPDDVVGRQAYADAGFTTIKKAELLNVRARSIYATTVRVNGRKWGVLLIDSERPQEITVPKKKLIDRYAIIMGEII